MPYVSVHYTQALGLELCARRLEADIPPLSLSTSL